MDEKAYLLEKKAFGAKLNGILADLGTKLNRSR
jgi:hypothetical protein